MLVKAQWIGASSFNGEMIPPEGLVKINDSTWSVPVDGKALTQNVPKTSGPMEVIVEYISFPNIFRSLSVADSAAPVIVSAELSYGNSAALDSTLVVLFSEPLREAPGMRPFLLWSRKNATLYRFNLTFQSFSDNSYRFLVDAIDAGDVSFASRGDSMWMDTAAHIADRLGAKQGNPLNRRVILDVKLPQPMWVTTVSSNPFVPGQIGTEISVQSKTPLIDPDRFSSRLSIYDAVGNPVLIASMPQKNKGFAYTWNGCNKNFRTVGAGIYPAMIRISENGNEVWSKVLRVGVKR
jgi:hypothetical protein